MKAELRAKKLREDERILQVIDERISAKDDHYERNKGILKKKLEDVFTTIKERNRFFREQFRGFFFVENYYKGPKISKPEEFYVNISIKIPLDDKLIMIERGELDYKMLKFCAHPSIDTSRLYKYSITREWPVCRSQKGSRSDYNFNKDRFRQSITNLLMRAILNIPRVDNYTIKVHEDSPAFTLCIKKQDLSAMKVNLMPVVEFDCKPPYSLKGAFKWYAVPDPLKDVKDQHLLWRLAFYNHENYLLTRHSYLTSTIRKLEKLLDAQGWTVISCYHIKTLFMHHGRSMQNDCGFTTMFKLTGIKLLIHMLDRLRNMCKTQYLENVWVFGHNIIGSDEKQFVGIAEELTTMIKEITDDPTKVAHWIFRPLSVEIKSLFSLTMMLSPFCSDVRRVDHVPERVEGRSDSSGRRLPPKRLRMIEDDGPGLSEDVRNTSDGIWKPVTNAIAASTGIESSLSTEAGNDKVRCPAEMNIFTVIARLDSSIEMLSRRLTALEQKSAATV